ncbi:MAG: hypothetical protein IJV00_09460 [Clostridia bacterium]|nr:hypothetical protein [Clostridia bacterium]
MKSFEIFPWGSMHSKFLARDAKKTFGDLKECGFTGSNFIEPADVGLCREAGLDPNVFIYASGDYKSDNDAFGSPRDGVVNVTKLIEDTSVPLATLEKAIEEALAQVPEGKVRIYLVDEPGAGLFERIAFAAGCVKKFRPDAECYVNLFPIYAVCGAKNISQLETETYEEYLEKFCIALPGMPVSYDNYDVIISRDGEIEQKMTRFYRNFVKARKICDRFGVDLFHVVCSNQLRITQTVPTTSNLLLQANASLAAGARSVSWFTYAGRGDYNCAPVDDNTGVEIRTPTWYLLKEVNRRLLSMGRELEKMKFEGLFFSDTDGIEDAKSVRECPSLKRFETSGKMMVGVYSDAGRRTYVTVNMSLKSSATLLLEDSNGKKAEIWSCEENRYIAPLLRHAHGESPLWIAPGDAAMLSVRI